MKVLASFLGTKKVLKLPTLASTPLWINQVCLKCVVALLMGADGLVAESAGQLSYEAVDWFGKWLMFIITSLL